jgi:N-acetylglutamate synthase-like GNAT family acetyltransferase
MPIIIRPAAAEDQFAITAIVRAAWLNPRDLDWRRFLLAEWGQDIIGVGQVKPHKDGSRELASIAVVPEWQGQGVGSAIIRTLLAREIGRVYLMCATKTAPYYERFGFHRIARVEMPAYFRRIDRMASVLSMLTFRRLGLVVMRHMV